MGAGDLLAANMVAGEGGTPPFSLVAAALLSPKTKDRAAPATAFLMLARGPRPACLPVRFVMGVAMTPVASRSRCAHAGLAMLTSMELP